MNKYFVRTIEDEPVVTIEESNLIDALDIKIDAEDRFPFDDLSRKNIEAYEIGSYEECQEYINSIDEKIRSYFKVEKL